MFLSSFRSRLMSAAPCIRDQVWSISKYFMGQLNAIVKAPNQKVSFLNNVSMTFPMAIDGMGHSSVNLFASSFILDIFIYFFQMPSNLSCQLSLSDLNSKPKNKHILSHRSSKVDVFTNPEWYV